MAESIGHGGRFDSDLITTFEMICEYACQMIRVDHSGFVRFDPLNETGEVVAQYPRYPKLVGRTLPLRGVPAEESLLNDDAPLVIEDVSTASELGEVRELLKEYGIRSICIVKVRFHDVVIGSFSLDSVGQKRAFTQEEISLCVSFAELASKMIEARQLANWLEAFHGATVAVTSERQIDSLLRTIIEQAQTLFAPQSVGLWQRVIDESGHDSLWLAACSDPELRGRRLAKSEGMAWHLLQSEKPYESTLDYDTYENRASSFEGVFGSVLAVPLLRQSERIGMIFLSDVRGRRFTDFDARMLRHFADVATIALRHTALVDRMRTLSIASAEISANFDSESLAVRLTDIGYHTTRILNAEMCGVFLLDGAGRLILRASYGHRADSYIPNQLFEVRDEPRAGLTGAIFARLVESYARRGTITTTDTKSHDEPIAYNAHGRGLLSDPAVHTGDDSSPAGRCYSLLAMPLVTRENNREEVVGMLRISNKKSIDGSPNEYVRFNSEDEWVLRIFSEAVVVAIQSARLFDKLKDQKDLYARLLETWNILASEEALDARLQKIARNVVSIAGKSFCRILLATSSEEFLHVNAAVINPAIEAQLSWNAQGREQTPIADWPHLVSALRKGNAYELVEGDDDNTLERLADLLELRDAEGGSNVAIHSLFAVPMRIEDRPVGLLSVGEVRQGTAIPTEFSLEEKNLITLIATQATFMIDREWRMENIQRAREGVHQLARALALGDQRDALQKIVDGIRDATRSDIVTLYTIRPTDGEIVGAATISNPGRRMPSLNVRPASISAVGRILKLDDLHAAADVDTDLILGGPFAEREGIQSALGTPIWLKDDDAPDEDGRLRVGVLFVNYRSRHTFTQDDKDVVKMFAHLAAVTIRNQELYEQQSRKARTEEALREAARLLTERNIDEPVQWDLQQTADLIATLARQVAVASGQNITSVTVGLVAGHQYELLATWPPEYHDQRKAQLWRTMALTAEDGVRGPVAEVFNTGHAVLMTSPSRTARPFESVHEDTLAQLVVPISDGFQVAGVIVVESSELYGIAEPSKKTFDLFATLAFDAIRTARTSADLEEAKRREKKSRDLAFFYINSGVLVHKHKGQVREFIKWAEMLRWDAEKAGITGTLLESFDQFEAAAAAINELLVSTSAGLEIAPIHELNAILQDWERQLRRDIVYTNLEIRFELVATKGARVRADPDLLREVFAILCSNSRKAMENRPRKELTVTTSVATKGSSLLITFADSGRGMDEQGFEADGVYLRTDTMRAKGAGYGLPTAQLIITRFGGEILKPRSNSTGTAITIMLPVAAG